MRDDEPARVVRRANFLALSVVIIGSIAAVLIAFLISPVHYQKANPEPPRVDGRPGVELGPPSLVKQVNVLLIQARVQFQAPSSVKQGETIRVKASISKADVTAIGQASASASRATSLSVPDGPFVAASLSGDGFAVSAVSPQDDLLRSTAEDELPEWQWYVKPTDAGTKTLVLTIRVYLNPKDPPAATRYVDGESVVERDYFYTIGSALSSPAWAATGLTVPVLCGAAIAVLRRRKRKIEASRADTDPHGVAVPDQAQDRRGYL